MYFLYLYLLYLEGNNGGACLCWCVPIPCVAQQMKQLSGDNFSPPRSATRKKMTKVQNDKILKYYKEIEIAKIQKVTRKETKGKNTVWRMWTHGAWGGEDCV